jgi:hypothetical protein
MALKRKFRSASEQTVIKAGCSAAAAWIDFAIIPVNPLYLFGN